MMVLVPCNLWRWRDKRVKNKKEGKWKDSKVKKKGRWRTSLISHKRDIYSPIIIRCIRTLLLFSHFPIGITFPPFLPFEIIKEVLVDLIMRQCCSSPFQECFTTSRLFFSHSWQHFTTNLPIHLYPNWRIFVTLFIIFFHNNTWIFNWILPFAW